MLKTYKIPFASRSLSYTKQEIDVVSKVMKHSKTLTQGFYLKKFENDFKEYIGGNFAFAVNRNICFRIDVLFQLKKGDEVIIPSHTYTFSAYPFIKQGAKIVWADIDLKTRVVNGEKK